MNDFKRSKRFVWLFLVGCLIHLTIVGQTELAGANKSCLWKVTSPNQAKNAVYLLGSIHLLKPENYPLKQSLLTAFENSQILLFEINLDSAETPEMQQFLLAKGMYTNDSTLQQSMSPETYAVAEKTVADLGLNIDLMHKFKPWFFSITLMSLKLKQLGFDPNWGVDKWFFDKAKQDHKTIVALETVADQLNLFDQLMTKQGEALILQTLEEFKVLEKEIDQLVLAWNKGDTQKLEALLLKSFKEYPEIYDSIVLKRNANWLPQIENQFKRQENCLVVVGSGHLIGKNSLIDLLKQKGYSIEQL